MLTPNNFKADWQIVWDCPVNLQTWTTYTIALTDRNSTIYMNNASANTLTIPLNSSVAFPIWTILSIVQQGTWSTTIQATAWVLLNWTDWISKILWSQYRWATIQKIDTNSWIIPNF